MLTSYIIAFLTFIFIFSESIFFPQLEKINKIVVKKIIFFILNSFYFNF